MNDNRSEAMMESLEYTYKNPLTNFITNLGHKVCEKMRIHKNSCVLDLGCGKGDHFQFVTSKNVVGLDTNSDRLLLSKRDYPDIPVIKGNVYSTPFKDESFDSIVAMYILEHLQNLQDALKEINRILRMGGEVVIAIPTEGTLYKLSRNLTTKRHVEKMCDIDYLALVKEEHVNECKDIVKDLKSIFKVTKIIGLPFLIPFTNLNIWMVVRCIKEKDYKKT